MKSLKIILTLGAVLIVGAGQSRAQDNSVKGIDSQNKQIQNIGNGQGPGDNGNRRNVGAGRGIDFGSGKTPDRTALANPYRMASKRDILLATVADIMRERSLVLDEAASRAADGILITQPYTFSKGAVLSQSQLSQYANLPGDDRDGAWTRGRYTLTVEVQTIDGANNNVSVTAKVEGRTETALGSQWLTLSSTGQAENDFLAAVVERVTGTTPYPETKPADEPDIKPVAKPDTKPTKKPQR